MTGGVGGVFGGFHYRIRFEDPDTGAGYPAIVATNVSLAGYFLAPEAVVQCIRCGDLRLPAGTPPAGGWPVVVLAHPGGFVGGSKDDPRMAAWADALAAGGFATFAVNYALADPHGLFPVYSLDCDIDLPAGAGGCDPLLTGAITAMRHDLQAAVRWLRMTDALAGSGGLGDPFGLDTGRLAILGESAGATGALEVLYRSDEPGTVGVTGFPSGVDAGVAIAGFVDDSAQDTGEGPALLITHTADPLGELFGFDMFDEAREVVARAAAVGNTQVRLTGWCDKVDTDGDGVGEPQHLAALGGGAFADQVGRTLAFLDAALSGAPVAGDARWGATVADPFVAGPTQELAGAHEPAIGDFDGDGRDDIYFYGAGTSCDTVWFGREDRSFTDPDEIVDDEQRWVPDLDGDYDTVVADLNGDGRDDIVFYDGLTGTAQLWYGSTDRTFTQIEITGAPRGVELLPGDFDGDGNDDLVMHAPGYPMGVVAYGTSTMGVVELTYAADTAPDAVPDVGDLDGDGRDDIMWSDPVTGLALTLWHAEADRTFTATPLIDLVPGIEVTIADHTGDGIADVTLSSDEYAVAITFTGVAGGGFVMAAWESIVPGRSLEVGDVDGDGRADLLWMDGSNVEVWFGAPPGTPVFSVKAFDSTGIAAPLGGDGDGDGRLDLLALTAG